jgi:DNA-binding MarR family transcriptional regulator
VQYENELNVVFALARALDCTLTTTVRQLAGLSLGPVELLVMALLADGRPRTAATLSSGAGCRSSTMTGVLDRLAGRGFIQRRAHPKDRRSILISLTTQGDATAREVALALGETASRALAGTSPARVHVARQVLAALGRL